MTVYNHGKMGLFPVTSPMCLGHESSGIIVRLGSNVAAQAAAASKSQSGQQGTLGKTILKLGDKVTVEPGVTCRMCVDCRGGNYQVSGTEPCLEQELTAFR